MRFFFIVVVLLLVVGFIGFTVTNLGAAATITVWGTEHPDVPIWQVVIVSLAVGAALIWILATVEGASIRLENRRLRREIHKLETELNFLRTTGTTTDVRQEPDALDAAPSRALPAARTAALTEPATMPVYDTDKDEWPPDSEDDDIYSGGRAV
jgi:uncharacterized membrane protein YciS (DUF1049 family)